MSALTDVLYEIESLLSELSDQQDIDINTKRLYNLIMEISE